VRVAFGDDVIEDSAFGRLPTKTLSFMRERALDKKRDFVAIGYENRSRSRALFGRYLHSSDVGRLGATSWERSLFRANEAALF
jgi:hypothetical protein